MKNPRESPARERSRALLTWLVSARAIISHPDWLGEKRKEGRTGENDIRVRPHYFLKDIPPPGDVSPGALIAGSSGGAMEEKTIRPLKIKVGVGSNINGSGMSPPPPSPAGKGEGGYSRYTWR